MTILNEELEWDDIASDDDRLAFKGALQKILLPHEMMLCRFITTHSKIKDIPGNATFGSPWWTDWDTAFAEITRWRTAWSSPRQIIRGRWAIPKRFSRELDSLVQIILTKPVYAWKGIARYQDDPIRLITYLGGAEQLFVPNLASNKGGLSSDMAYMHCFSSIESLNESNPQAEFN
jgi:hypothetical protein